MNLLHSFLVVACAIAALVYADDLRAQICWDPKHPETCYYNSIYPGKCYPLEPKFGDPGSTFRIFHPAITCRLYNRAIDKDGGCKEPNRNAWGETGLNKARASRWYSAPGIEETEYGFQARSYMCTSTAIKDQPNLDDYVESSCHEKYDLCNADQSGGKKDKHQTDGNFKVVPALVNGVQPESQSGDRPFVGGAL